MVYDFDGRMNSLLNTPWIKRDRINYTYYPPHRTKDDVKQTFQKLNEDFEALQVMLKLGQSDVNTVILDGLPAHTFALIMDSIPLTHGQGTKGRKYGALNVPGMEDYLFESNAVTAVMAFLKSLPVQNVIVTCQVVDDFEKENPADPYSKTIKVGEKLPIRNKLAATIPGGFDHIFRFDRKVFDGKNHIYVTFWNDIARTVYPNMPFEPVDITDKSFYKVLMSYANLEQKAEGAS